MRRGSVWDLGYSVGKWFRGWDLLQGLGFRSLGFSVWRWISMRSSVVASVAEGPGL